jgi:Na+-translocating ferredoxin:NAD+ oxidoreductase RnfG subunit
MRAPSLLPLGPVAAVTLLTAAPTSVFAVDYQSAEQAMHSLFPEADRFEKLDVALDAAQLKKLDEAGVRARSVRWQVHQARRGEALLGQVILDEVLGKFELISYAVGFGGDGAVKQVEILSYRESHGSEIRLPAWRRQFVGKKASDPVELGQDIANLSGATLSCRHVTEGVKRLTRLVALLRSEGRLR